jgi:hypothetical protein
MGWDLGFSAPPGCSFASMTGMRSTNFHEAAQETAGLDVASSFVNSIKCDFGFAIDCLQTAPCSTEFTYNHYSTFG